MSKQFTLKTLLHRKGLANKLLILNRGKTLSFEMTVSELMELVEQSSKEDMDRITQDVQVLIKKKRNVLGYLKYLALAYQLDVFFDRKNMNRHIPGERSKSRIS